MTKRKTTDRHKHQTDSIEAPRSNTIEEKSIFENQHDNSKEFYLDHGLVCPVSHEYVMKSKEYWSSRYGREISIEETLEIIRNIQSFFLAMSKDENSDLDR